MATSQIIFGAAAAWSYLKMCKDVFVTFQISIFLESSANTNIVRIEYTLDAGKLKKVLVPGSEKFFSLQFKFGPQLIVFLSPAISDE